MGLHFQIVAAVEGNSPPKQRRAWGEYGDTRTPRRISGAIAPSGTPKPDQRIASSLKLVRRAALGPVCSFTRLPGQTEPGGTTRSRSEVDTGAVHR